MTTLQDLIQMKKLEGFRLIAGKEGLNREIKTCCVLDYEYDPEMKNRFQHTNFQPGMLVLTSFLYAKDHEYLIIEAIQKLIAADISALAIKNIYHLHISNSVLRYADSRAFPIFLVEDTTLFVEQIILSIHAGIRIQHDLAYHQQLIHAILHQPLSPEGEAQRACELCPGIGKHYAAAYFYDPEHPITMDNWERILAAVKKIPHAMGYCYRGGVLLLCSTGPSAFDAGGRAFADLLQPLRELLPASRVGIGLPHHQHSELREAMEESIQAAIVCRAPGVQLYTEIGTYAFLFSAHQTAPMGRFSRQILNPVIDYDAQTGSALTETLRALVDAHGDLHRLSRELGLHENTLRQRLGKIADLTRLDYRKPEQYEQLSMAVKIDNCQRWTDRGPSL